MKGNLPNVGVFQVLYSSGCVKDLRVSSALYPMAPLGKGIMRQLQLKEMGNSFSLTFGCGGLVKGNYGPSSTVIFC